MKQVLFSVTQGRNKDMSFGSPVGERAEETENTLLLLESKRLNIYSKNLNLT